MSTRPATIELVPNEAFTSEPLGRSLGFKEYRQTPECENAFRDSRSVGFCIQPEITFDYERKTYSVSARLTTTTNHPAIFKSKEIQSALLGHQTDPETAWDAPGVQEKWKTCVTDLSWRRDVADTTKAIESHAKDNKKTSSMTDLSWHRGVADTMKAIESHVKDNKKTYGHTNFWLMPNSMDAERLEDDRVWSTRRNAYPNGTSLLITHCYPEKKSRDLTARSSRGTAGIPPTSSTSTAELPPQIVPSRVGGRRERHNAKYN